MLQIKSMPNYASLIQHIARKNIHLVPGNPHVAELFKLIESESSPFRISKQGSGALSAAIEIMPSLEKYAPLIKKTLAIRILQKSKGFYTSIKFKSLEKLLSFFGSWDEIESLLYECNRQSLVMTIADHDN